MARLAITVALLALGASGFRTGEAAGLRTGGLRAAFALWEPAARPARPRWLETLRRGGAGRRASPARRAPPTRAGSLADAAEAIASGSLLVAAQEAREGYGGLLAGAAHALRVFVLPPLDGDGVRDAFEKHVELAAPR